MLGLEPQIGLRPFTGDHDGRRHAAQFAGDLLAEQRLRRTLASGRLARCPFDTRAEDDGIVAGRTSGDVHVRHRLVVHEVLADVGTPGHDPQEAAVDQWCERPAEDRQDGIGHRIEFEHNDPVVGVQLVEHIQRWDRGDVAGAQHQPDTAGVPLGALPETRFCPDLIRRHARLHPDVGGIATEQQFVEDAVRQDLDADPVSWGSAQLEAVDGTAAAFQRPQALGQRRQSGQHGVGTGNPLLTQ